MRIDRKTGMLTAGLVIAVMALSLGVSVAGAAKTKLISSASTLTPNDTPRKTVLCPKKNPRFKFPYGGGMYSTSQYEMDGAGVYPHSYERLGVQGGYHVTPVYYDPSPMRPAGRRTSSCRWSAAPSRASSPRPIRPRRSILPA